MQAKHPPHVRALCFEAIGILSSDDVAEAVTEGSAPEALAAEMRTDKQRRAEEFGKLRGQVLHALAM